MKWCSKCKQDKDKTEFDKDRGRTDGLQSWCRVCRTRYNLEYYSTNQAKLTTQKKIWCTEHRTEVKAQQKMYNKSEAGKVSAKLRRERRLSTLRGYLNKRRNNIKQRCENPNCCDYPRYGGKGITCQFTKDEFYNHVVNVLGHSSVDALKGLEIHRIDNDGNYEPGNIEFLTNAKHKQRHAQIRKNLKLLQDVA